MTLEDIKLKLDMAEQKLIKLEQTIARLEKQRDKKLDCLQKLGIDPMLVDIGDIKQSNFEIYSTYTDYTDKLESLKTHRAKADEIRAQAKHYEAALNHEMARDAFIRNEVPQVILDFFDDWERNAYIAIQNRYDAYQALKQQLTADLREARVAAISALPEYEELRSRRNPSEMSDYELANVRPYKPVEAFLRERSLDYRSIAQRKQAAAGPYVAKMLQFRTPEEQARWLAKTLAAEKRERILDLSDRVGAIVGRITDASGLHLQNGEICGTIIGAQGAASIQTIGAGGYNIQCFHYRTLIREVEIPQHVPETEDEEDCDLEM